MDDAQEQKHFYAPFLLAGLVIFAFIFSAVSMMPQSIGLDEAQSLWQAEHSIGGIFYVVGQDVHVPLYHILLHYWVIQFGDGVIAARTLSLLFYLATIPLVYILGKLAFRSSLGLFAAAVFALSPFTNWYGSIIRMYSLLAFWTVLNQIFFFLIAKGRPERRPLYWAGFFVSALFGMYTHYFFFFVLATEGLFYLAYRKFFPSNALRFFIINALVLFLLFVPWLWYVRSLGGFANTSPKLLPPTTVDVFNTFSNFLFGFQTDPVNTIILSSWPLFTLFIFFAIQKNKKVPPEAVYFVASFLIPIIAAAAVSRFVTPFYLSRYFIGVFPAFCLAASWFLSLYPRSTSTFMKMALVGIMVVSLQAQTAGAATPVKEDYRDVSTYVSEGASSRDVVAMSAPFTVYPFEYYYTGEATLITLPIWNRLQFGPIPSYSTSTLAENVDTLKGYEKLWLVLSYDQGYEQPLRIYMDTHFERIEAEHFSPGLDLYVYRLRYDNATLADVRSIIRAQTAQQGAVAPQPTQGSQPQSTLSLQQNNL